ncbi:hypothetical protein ACFQU2_25685 [Siccirubricoccus deserti]
MAAGLLLLGGGLTYVALRGGWSWTLEEVQDAPPTSGRRCRCWWQGCWPISR